ncbi:MAG: cold-shock protein [Chitinophagales bacterium]
MILCKKLPLVNEIRENDKVTFEVQNGKKGLNAANVRVI